MPRTQTSGLMSCCPSSAWPSAVTTTPASSPAVSSSGSRWPAPLVHEPELLLADEPTGNLDRQTGARVLDIMSDLRRRFGTTLVLVTHDSAVARLADRLLSLDEGKLVQGDETAGILADSASLS